MNLMKKHMLMRKIYGVERSKANESKKKNDFSASGLCYGNWVGNGTGEGGGICFLSFTGGNRVIYVG